ncbi:hypothetical protein TWF506_006244 [Arthrobotrys conoides]|uniref:Tropomyosin n=1 Tax=Arthrobotrys conoides TaxID=74498 RepID=A0AAN8NLQ5_9PEZI
MSTGLPLLLWLSLAGPAKLSRPTADQPAGHRTPPLLPASLQLVPYESIVDIKYSAPGLHPSFVFSVTPNFIKVTPLLPVLSFAMDRIKEKLAKQKADLDAANDKVEELEAKIKEFEAEQTKKEGEISSLTSKNTQLEADLEKLEERLAEVKKEAAAGANLGVTSDNLQRKVTVLEEEAETTEKQLKETIEKLRLTDVKAEHFERKVQGMEAERDNWEKKYEEEVEKYKKAKAELDELAASLENL